MTSLIQRKQEYWTSALNVLRDKERRSWILLNPTSIGDTWIVCALSKAFKEMHGGYLTLVIKPFQAPLTEMYSKYIDRVVAVENLHDVCDRIQPQTTFDIDQPIIAHPFWHGDGRLGRLAYMSTIINGRGLFFFDLYRFLLRLDWNTQIERPTISEYWQRSAIEYAHEVGLVEGNSVILFPDNNSNKNFPDAIWEKIAKGLISEGKTVFTNLAGGEYSGRRSEPIKGTKAINVTLPHVFSLAEYAGRVISGATGLRVMLLASEVAAEVTTLIYKPGPDENYHVTQDGGDAVFAQSLKFTGFRDWSKPVYEYVICPLENPDLDAVADDVVRSNKERYLKW